MAEIFPNLIKALNSQIQEQILNRITTHAKKHKMEHHYQITKKTVKGNILKNSHRIKGQITYSRTKITTIKDFRSEICKPENTEQNLSAKEKPTTTKKINVI